MREAARLAVRATLEVSTVVEQMHRTIASGPLGVLAPVASPVTGLAYGMFRGVTRAVGTVVDGALGHIAAATADLGALPVREREAVVAALNGVVGDFLVEQRSPLAIPMRVRGAPARQTWGGDLHATPLAQGKAALLIHGSSMSDLQWLREGRDHGAALRDLGYAPLYLHYNSGLHVSTNGAALSALLESLGSFDELLILGFSMGGLVARSALHAAQLAGHRWPRSVRRFVSLGTPHHGAALERAGSLVHLALGVSRYSAPIAELARLRSEGVTDLRHGNVRDEDWRGLDRFARHGDRRKHLPLPEGIRCLAVAASRANGKGDGLVSVDSALGKHAAPSRCLSFHETHVLDGIGHLDLLSDPRAFAAVRAFVQR